MVGSEGVLCIAYEHREVSLIGLDRKDFGSRELLAEPNRCKPNISARINDHRCMFTLNYGVIPVLQPVMLLLPAVCIVVTIEEHLPKDTAVTWTIAEPYYSTISAYSFYWFRVASMSH
jgi:hypothetical protein